MNIDKAFISFRIGAPLWMSEEGLRDLLVLFSDYPGLTDDLVFFLGGTHAAARLEFIEKQVSILPERMAMVRENGYGVGINILTTIGHHEENLPGSLSGDYCLMTNIDGMVCRGSLCPNDERVRAYVRRLYQMLAAADPDYIWIDDDVRLFGHMPITCGCFCNNCLEVFQDECGECYSRESLMRAFNEDSLPRKLQVRKQWLQHNRNTINRLCNLIEQTVHSVRPGLPIGFMTGERFFEGYDFDTWVETLAGPEKSEVLWRPGGGFYADGCLMEMVGKSHDIGRQIAYLPENVVRIQSEVENFPYQSLKKSGRVTALEAASHIAAGCTGAAFNVIGSNPMFAPAALLDEYRSILSETAAARPFYDLLARVLKRDAPVGLYTGWHKNMIATHNVTKDDWLSGDIEAMADSHAIEMLEIGLPAAYLPENAQVTLLSGDTPLAMSESQLDCVLSSGVYMDAEALTRLNEMGYAELTGFDVQGFVTDDGIETLSECLLNGPSAGSFRDCRQSFKWWLRPAAVLVPKDAKCAALAQLIDYGGNVLAKCCMGLYENRLGGRVCIAGYYPWTFLQSQTKSTQLKSVTRWLSRDRLIAYVSSFHKINLWTREMGNGVQAVVLMNCCLDTTEGLTLMLLTRATEVAVFDMCGEETRIGSSGYNGSYREFVLPPVPGWEMRLITTG